MLSKRVMASAILMSSVSFLANFLVGCSYFKDTNHRSDVLEMHNAELTRSCLSSSVDVLTQYFMRKDNATLATTEVIDCAASTIDLFQTNVKGDDRSSYSAAELINFINKFFPEIADRATETVPSFLRLKSSILGGSSETLTIPELKTLRAFILSFKPAAEGLAPFADVYALNVKGKLDETLFDNAVAALQDTVTKIVAPLPDRTNSAFQIEDLQNLLASFDNTKHIESFMPLALAMKQIVVRPPATAIGGNDWKLVIKSAAKLYGAFLRYHYYVKEYFEPEHSMLADANPRHLEILAHSAMSILHSGLAARPLQPNEDLPYITGTDLALLVDELHKKSLLPTNLRPESIKRMIWPITARFLQKGARAQREFNDIDKLIPKARLGKEELDVLESDVRDFFAGHRMSVALTQNTGKYNSASVASGFSRTEIRDAKVTGSNSSAVSLAAEAMQTILSGGSRYLVFDRENRMKVVPNNETIYTTRNDLVKINASRIMVQAILRGYGGRPFRWIDSDKGLTEAQTQEFYLDFRSLGVDLDLMDSRVTTAGARSFMEANLFMSISNGDTTLSLQEALEFFNSIMSAGKIADQVYIGAEKLCDPAGKKPYVKDITNRQMLPMGCFREYLKSNFSNDFANLPGMTRFVLEVSRDPIAWRGFIRAIEDASRAGGYNSGPIEYADIRVLATVVHYTESLFINFDDNRDAILSEDEISRAFPIFKDFLSRLTGIERPIVLRKIFSFMIRAGRPPATKTELSLWALADSVVSVSATRSDVAGIMASLAIQSRQSKLDEIQKYLLSHRGEIFAKLKASDDFTARQLMILFQCDPTEIKDMQALMPIHAKRWLALPVTPETFAKRVDREIKRHTELAKRCVPLY